MPAAPYVPRWKARLVVVPVLLALLTVTGVASADQNDTVNVTLGVTAMHDSNLFRLSSAADANLVLGRPNKSDDIGVTSLGLKFGKSYSLQRFEFEGTLVDYRYRTFSYLDFTARNYTAAWRWSLTPRLHGNITRNRTESLNSFSDYTGYSYRNLRTDETTRFDGVFELGGWQLIGALSEAKRENSQLFVQENDSTLDTAEAGLRYVFPSGTSLAAVSRTGHGKYTNRPEPILFGLYDNGFDQTEHEARLTWPITGKTAFYGRIAHLQREHDHYAARDYAGTVGSLGMNWDITAKTHLNASLTRELGSYQTLSNSYIRTDRLVVAPYWQISSRVNLRLNYDYSRRDYLGAIANTAVNGRTDTVRQGSVALEWQPLTTLLLSASLQKDRRSSNLPGLDYDSTMGSVSAQMSF